MTSFSTDTGLQEIIAEHKGRRKSTSAAISDALLDAHQAQLEAKPARLIKRALFLRPEPQKPSDAIVPMQRPKEPYSAEKIDAYFSGVLRKIDILDQATLRQYKIAERELERTEDEIAETDRDSKAQLKTLQRRLAFWQSERDYEREKIELFLLGGGQWGEYDRTCRWYEAWNEAARDDSVLIGVKSVTQDELDQINREWFLWKYRQWLEGLETGDVAKKAYFWSLDRKKCELARKQRAAGIPLDLDG